MILSKEMIVQRIDSGDLGFSPPIDRFQLQQHSIDLRLGFTFMIPKLWKMTDVGRVALTNDHLNANREENSTIIELEEGQVFDLLPDEYVVATTLESLKIPNDLMCVLYPRSSVNRRRLSVDLTGITDAGYNGNLIIPIRNNTKSQVIRLYPGERFCQLVFQPIEGMVDIRESRWHGKDVVVGTQDEQDLNETRLIMSGEIAALKRDYAYKISES